MKQAGVLIAAGFVLTACAQQGGTANQAAAPAPEPTPVPVQGQATYNLNGGSMTVVTEPAPAVRRTSAALDLVESKTLLDVARQATLRVANADAGQNSVINAVALPTTDVALRVEQILLGRLGNVFSLAVKVNQVGNPARAFPFTPEGAQELAGKLGGAGIRGYALDARTEYLDLETTGGTIENPVEQFSLSGKVRARLIDISNGAVIRQAVCVDKQQMGTLRDIFVAEGKPVPQSEALAAVAAPVPAPAAAQAASGTSRPASETSAAALALIEKTGQGEKSQKLEGESASAVPLPEATATAEATPTPTVAEAEPAPAATPEPTPTAEPAVQPAPAQETAVAAATPVAEVPRQPIVITPPKPEPTAQVATAQTDAPAPQSAAEADAQAEAGTIAAQAAAAVTAASAANTATATVPEPTAATTVAEPAVSAPSQQVPTPQPTSVAVATPQPTPVATPQPTAEDRVQAALRQAAPSRAEVVAQEAAEQAAQETPRNVPIRRTGAFAGVVQSALEESPDQRVFQSQRRVTVQGAGVKQKARLDLATLALAQATAPITYPGPGESGRVSDGAADRLIRKCTEELWQQIVPK